MFSTFTAQSFTPGAGYIVTFYYADVTVRRTNIVMADWYAFKDPRHYYYGVYTMARAKQQEGADKQFEFAEKRNLLGGLDDATRDALVTALIPLRHY